MTELIYSKQGDYYLPNLTIPDNLPEIPTSRYAQLRRHYLQDHLPGYYTELVTHFQLAQHLIEIQERANSRFELLVEQMTAEEGLTEELKAQDMMAWVGRMNNLRMRADKLVMEEIIYG